MNFDREKVIELDDEISFIMDKCNAAQDEERPLSIALCGAFSTGKTSLVNALLDYSIELPTGDVPITHRVTKITYGEKNKAVLKFDDGTCMDVADGDLWRVATEYSEKNGILYIETPSEFLKQGIMLIDTPGFDEDIDEKFDEITKKEIKNADFCILTFHASRVGNNNEKAFIEEMNSLNEGFFLPVINCMNVIVDDESVFKRAEELFENCGNDLIGKSKYFAVYSKKGEVELMGLPEWIEEKLIGNSVYLKHNMPLKHAKYALKNLYDKSVEHQKKVQELIIKLTNTIKGAEEAWKSKNKKKWSDVSKIIMESKIFLRENIFSDIYAEIRGLSDHNFRNEVKSVLRSNLSRFAYDMFEALHASGSEMEEKLLHAFEYNISESGIPLPIRYARRLSFLERVMSGEEYEYSYNDYCGEAIKYIENNLKANVVATYESIMKEAIKKLSDAEVMPKDVVSDMVRFLLEGWENHLEEYSDRMIRLSRARNDVLILLDKYERG